VGGGVGGERRGSNPQKVCQEREVIVYQVRVERRVGVGELGKFRAPDSSEVIDRLKEKPQIAAPRGSRASRVGAEEPNEFC